MSLESAVLEEQTTEEELSEPQLEELEPGLDLDSDFAQQAREEAVDELSDMYGFDFQEIAARNDEILREDPRNNIKSDLKTRERYNRILETSENLRPYAPPATFGAMLFTAILEGSQPAIGDYSASLFVGGATCAALYGLSFALQVGDKQLEPSGYTIMGEEDALEYVEDMENVKVDGQIPYTFATGEEAATDLEDITGTGKTVAVAKSYGDGKKEITLLQNNYPENDEVPEFHSYTVSGLSGQPMPEGKPSEENWDILKQTVDAGEYIEFSETGWPELI